MVAERVMRWTSTGIHGRLTAYGDRLVTDSQVTGDGKRIDFAPSRCIEHAWEVVERMARLAGTFQLGDGYVHLTFAESAGHGHGMPRCNPNPVGYEDAEIDLPWSFHVHLGLLGKSDEYPAHWTHGSRFCARAATAPHAICLAALAAVAARPAKGEG